MIALWGFLLGLPLLAFGGATLYSPSLSRRFSTAFAASTPVAAVLTALAWLWASYEIMTFGVNPFAEFAAGQRFFPMKQLLTFLAFLFDHFWMLTPLLIVLTIKWMRKDLPVRALTGVLMLIPAELFKTTHLYRPPVGAGLSAIDLIVLTAYCGAVLGMYGMFYPWRLEKGLTRVLACEKGARLLGGACLVWGAAIIIICLSL